MPSCTQSCFGPTYASFWGLIDTEKTQQNSRKHEKTMPRCTQSRFGPTYAFKNTAEVHAKSLWGLPGRPKTPRKPEKTMHRWTQSHLGLSCAFKPTAQVHITSLWARGQSFCLRYAYVLHGTLNNRPCLCYLCTLVCTTCV